jgi:hypothetical protein
MLLAMPVALAAGRFARIDTALRAGAAVASVATGVLLAWQLGAAAVS